MSITYKYIIPSLAVIALTASVAVAQMPGGALGGMRGNHSPRSTEQLAARRTQMCTELQARGAARLAYMEERLSLTPAQKPLFERWKTVMQSENADRQANCAKPRPDLDGKRPTLLERNARMEERLKARLASLENTRPAEEALYNALTPDQKAMFEHRGRMRMAMGGRGFGGGRFHGRDSDGPGFGRGPGGPRGGI